MRRSWVAALMVGVAAVFVLPVAGFAGDAGNGAKDGAKKVYARHHHRGTRVRGFATRSVGGYSYVATDTINTYGDARGRYGAATSFRDPAFGRQTTSGPFDNDFFFDTGVGSVYGGNAPYLH